MMVSQYGSVMIGKSVFIGGSSDDKSLEIYLENMNEERDSWLLRWKDRHSSIHLKIVLIWPIPMIINLVVILMRYCIAIKKNHLRMKYPSKYSIYIYIFIQKKYVMNYTLINPRKKWRWNPSPSPVSPSHQPRSIDSGPGIIKIMLRWWL